MKYTVLDLTQTILSSMDSDEINSISDTVESMQVANIIKTAYFDLIGRANLPEHNGFFNLTSSADSTKPTVMYLPSDCKKITWVKYNKETADDTNVKYETLDPLDPSIFLNRMYALNTDETNVASYTLTYGTNMMEVLYMNDRAPCYYTSLDDRTILFDSYDVEVDTTLQTSKTMLYGNKVIPFSLADSFIPDLDEGQFALLLNEAKSLAWMELKQSPHNLAERNGKRGWTTLQNKKYAISKPKALDQLTNFGRR